jgi:hypothetical protein
MRACVHEGRVNFDSWEALGESITARDFADLEHVALVDADMRWQHSVFLREWMKANPNASLSAPLAVPDEPTQTLAESGEPIELRKLSAREMNDLVANARRMARQARADGMKPTDDPVAWLAKMRHNQPG